MYYGGLVVTVAVVVAGLPLKTIDESRLSNGLRVFLTLALSDVAPVSNTFCCNVRSSQKRSEGKRGKGKGAMPP